MAKSIPSSGAGAVRIILKNKDAFHFDLREKKEDNGYYVCEAGNAGNFLTMLDVRSILDDSLVHALTDDRDIVSRNSFRNFNFFWF